jgi:hypothetical protein
MAGTPSNKALPPESGRHAPHQLKEADKRVLESPEMSAISLPRGSPSAIRGTLNAYAEEKGFLTRTDAMDRDLRNIVNGTEGNAGWFLAERNLFVDLDASRRKRNVEIVSGTGALAILVAIIYFGPGYGGSDWLVAIPLLVGALACMGVLFIVMYQVGQRIYWSDVIVARYRRVIGKSSENSSSEWEVRLYVGPARSEDWKTGRVTGRNVTQLHQDPTWSAAGEELAQRVRSTVPEPPLG